MKFVPAQIGFYELPSLRNALGDDGFPLKNKFIKEYKSGAVFVGNIEQNQKQGEGSFKWPNGCSYKGGFQGNFRSGKGSQIWPDGSEYTGDFEADQRHGSGIQKWPNEEEYDGQFFKDRKHGKGQYKWPSGATFKGMFFMDQKEGYGTSRFPDGTMFQGLYKEDEREGPGVMSYQDGKQDVGLWRKERLIRISLAIDDSFSIRDYPEFEYEPKDYEKIIRVSDGPYGVLGNLKTKQKKAGGEENKLSTIQFDSLGLMEEEEEGGMMVESLFSSRLPSVDPRTLTYDQEEFDKAFFGSPAPEEEIGEVAFNQTPSLLSLQQHALRHRAWEEGSVTFDPRQVLRGDRRGFGPVGPLEEMSETLLYAALKGDNSTVQGILRSKLCFVDVMDRQGHTALHLAAIKSHHEIINTLLNFGADVDRLTDEGVSALSACHVLFYDVRNFVKTTAEEHVKKILRQAAEMEIYLEEQKAEAERVQAAAAAKAAFKAAAATAGVMSSGAAALSGSGKVKRKTSPARALPNPPTPEGEDKSQDELDNEYGDEEEVGEDIGAALERERRKARRLRLQKKLKLDLEYAVPTGRTEQLIRDVNRSTFKLSNKQTLLDTASIYTPEGPSSQLQVPKEVEITKSEVIQEGAEEDDINRLDEPQNDNEEGPVSEFESARSLCNFDIEVSPALLEKTATTLSEHDRIKHDLHSTNPDPGTVRDMARRKAERTALIETIRLLLHRGADPNAAGVPLPVLFFALKCGDAEAVRNLLSRGASTEQRLPNEKGGLAPLHIAVTLPGPAGLTITRLLLQAGANPNISAHNYDEEVDVLATTDDTGVDEGQRLALRELNQGIESIEASAEGRKPLDYACLREDDYMLAHQIVKVLLESGANPNVLNPQGHCPLSVCITSGNDPAIDELLANRADPSLPLSHGNGSALCIACSTDYEFRRSAEERMQLISKLITVGANILAPIMFGSPPKKAVGTAVDYAYFKYYQDKRVAYLPYHALNPQERETFNARRDMLAAMGALLRRAVVKKEYDRLLSEEEGGNRSISPSEKFFYSGHGANTPLGVVRPKVDSATSQPKPAVPVPIDHLMTRKREGGLTEQLADRVAAIQGGMLTIDSTQHMMTQGEVRKILKDGRLRIRKPLFKYCYECGRSVGVRLAACTRCKEVFYCSKSCKLKAWNARHKDECVRLANKAGFFVIEPDEDIMKAFRREHAPSRPPTTAVSEAADGQQPLAGGMTKKVVAEKESSKNAKESTKNAKESAKNTKESAKNAKESAKTSKESGKTVISKIKESEAKISSQPESTKHKKSEQSEKPTKDSKKSKDKEKDKPEKEKRERGRIDSPTPTTDATKKGNLLDLLIPKPKVVGIVDVTQDSRQISKLYPRRELYDPKTQEPSQHRMYTEDGRELTENYSFV